MDDGVPLPSVLSGDVQERLIRLDKSLFYIVAGALEKAVDIQIYEETGTLTVDEARVALGEMLWGFYTLTPFSLPAGTMTPYGGATVPDGWLECIGQSLLRADYPALFTAIGVTWGAADGTHFTLPDLRGRAPIGAGQGTGLTNRALAASGGFETHTLTSAEMPVHQHNARGSGAVTPNSPYINAPIVASGPFGVAITSPTGGGGAHANMQPWAGVKFIIYAGD